MSVQAHIGVYKHVLCIGVYTHATRAYTHTRNTQVDEEEEEDIEDDEDDDEGGAPSGKRKRAVDDEEEEEDDDEVFLCVCVYVCALHVCVCERCACGSAYDQHTNHACCTSKS